MRVIIQRSKNASVTVDGSAVGSIDRGVVCLVGICEHDTLEDAKWVATRILGVKLWENEAGKPWRKSVANMGFGVLIVSQFTLHAKLGAKHVPDFRKSMAPAPAKVLYDQLVDLLKAQHKEGPVEQGQFGADMDVALVNDGPVTITIDSPMADAAGASTAASVGSKDDTTKKAEAPSDLESSCGPKVSEITGKSPQDPPGKQSVTLSDPWPSWEVGANPDDVADTFNKDGFVVLRNLLQKEFVSELKAAASSNFDACLDLIAARKLEFGMHASKGFREIVQRNKGRYEMPYGMHDTPAFQQTDLLANPRLSAVLDSIFGGRGGGGTDWGGVPAAASQAPEQSGSTWHLLGRSIVMSLPGAQEQQWHVDGAHVDVATHRPVHVLNVFLPLVDITPANGPTELRPGSHFLSRDLTRLTLLAKVKKTLRPCVSPCPSAGDALIFDYRTVHRGRANLSATPRPVLVLTFSKTWFKDLYNFPRRSIHDTEAVIPALPPLPHALEALTVTTIGVVVTTQGNKRASLVRAVRSALAESSETIAVQVVVCIDGPNVMKFPGEPGFSVELFCGSEPGVDVEVFTRSDIRTVRLTEASGGRPGIVRNAGLAALLGPNMSNPSVDWVAFLDDDDFWLPGKISAQLSVAEKNGSVMVCTGAVEDHAYEKWLSGAASESLGEPPPVTMPANWPNLPKLLAPRDFQGGNPAVCSSVIVSSKVVASTGSFGDAKYGQDFDYWKRCVIDAEVAGDGSTGLRRVSFVPQALIVYGTGSGRSTSRKETRQAVSAIASGIVQPSSRGAGQATEANSVGVSGLIQGFLGV